MNDPEGVPELQGPPEVLEAIDRFLADPSTGIRAGRPRRKIMFDPVDDAEIETDEEQYPKSWWLWLVLGAIALGFLIRMMMRRR